MSRTATTVAVFLLLTLRAVAVVNAQVCSGFASLERAPYQVGAAAQFSSASRTYGAGFTYGTQGPMGTVEVGTTRYANFDGSSLDFAVGGGWQLAGDRLRRFQVCPVIGFSHVSGPHNIKGTGVGYSETDLRGGVSAGLLIPTAGAVEVIPGGSFVFENADSKLTSGFLENATTRTFGEASFGIGFVFNGAVTLQPDLTIPVGLSGGVTAFGLTVAVNFGKAGTGKPAH